MRVEHKRFFSDGLSLSGSFFLPEAPDDGRAHPLVIPCSGFTGLMSIHPELFARFLTRYGFMCFGFDYRGFAQSEGERHRVILSEQVRDVRNAVAFASSDKRVLADRIVLLGWGMGAGIVLDAARELGGVCGICAVNGFYNGARFQTAHRGAGGYEAFLHEVSIARMEAAQTGGFRMADPFSIYPMDSDTTEYVDNVLRKVQGYGPEQMGFDFADSLIHWRPEAYAPHMKIPLLVCHGSINRLHPPQEAQSLFDAYGGKKEIYWIDGADHTSWMRDDHPHFQALGKRIREWIEDLLRPATPQQ